jgi:hypothetical protein
MLPVNSQRDEKFDECPDVLPEVPDEDSELDEFDLPSMDDDTRWDAFIADDDERDPLPAPGDFWFEDCQRSKVESREP